MNITIQGTQVELTDSERAFVEQKLEHCFRPLGDMNLEAVTVAVELELTTRRHPQERETEQRYRAEANVTLPGRFIRAEGTGPTLRRAVVQMKHKLTRELGRWRNRLIDDAREGARTVKFDTGQGSVPGAVD